MPANNPSLDTTRPETDLALTTLAQRSASGQGSAVTLRGRFRWIEFELAVTNRTWTGGDALDVYIQARNDGANWRDVVHFYQDSFTGSPYTFLQKAWVPVHPDLTTGGTVAMFEQERMAGGTAAEALLGREIRATWVISGTGQFTFQVLAFLRG